MRHVLFRIGALSVVIILLASCGGGGGSDTPAPQPSNPSPSVSGLQPASRAAGTDGFTLTVNGQNFLSSSTVTVGGNARTATFASSTQLNVAVLATDLGTPGALAVSVTNPAPGGGTASATFTVDPPAAPALTAVSPSPIPPGTTGPLSAAGSNFVRASVVQWNGSARPTTYVNNTRLDFNLQTGDAAPQRAPQPAANGTVTVSTPSPGGGMSNAVNVAVEYPIPVITGLTPNPMIVRGNDEQLTVRGTDFFPGALVHMNNLSRVTEFISSTELRATLLAADLTPLGTRNITVVNPAPTAGISNVVTLPLQNPIPNLSSVTPSELFAASSTNLQITGADFVPGIRVTAANANYWPLLTTFVSSTEISVAIHAVANTYLPSTELRAENPDSGGQPSNPLTILLHPSGPGIEHNIIPYLFDQFHRGAQSASADLRYLFPHFFYEFSSVLVDTCFSAPPGCALSEESVGDGESARTRLISANGRYVVFQVHSTAIDITVTEALIYQRDLCLNAPPGCSPSSKQIVSYSAAGEAIEARLDAFSPDGRYVLYRDRQRKLLRRDTCTGATGCTPASELVSLDPSGVEVEAGSATMSSSGRYIAFTAPTGVDPDTDKRNVFIRDTCLGASLCTPATTLLVTQPLAVFDDRAELALSASNRFLLTTGAFVDTLGRLPQTFESELQLVDTCIGATGPCTPSAAAILANGTGPAITGLSGGGVGSQFFGDRYVAFSSTQPDLAPNDTNRMADAFLHDNCFGAITSCTPSTRRLSLNADGVQANGPTAPLFFNQTGSHLLLFTYQYPSSLGDPYPYVVAPTGIGSATPPPTAP